jgi:hypothetical protein
MTSGAIAAFISILALGFIEAMGRFYPSKALWLRLRSRHGRRAIRAMRRRLEEATASRLPFRLAFALLVLVVAWIAAASLLDKRWYEVVADVLPYVIVGVAMLRTPPSLRKISERIRKYERDIGEDPDSDYEGGEGGAAAIAL